MPSISRLMADIDPQFLLIAYFSAAESLKLHCAVSQGACESSQAVLFLYYLPDLRLLSPA